MYYLIQHDKRCKFLCNPVKWINQRKTFSTHYNAQRNRATINLNVGLSAEADEYRTNKTHPDSHQRRKGWEKCIRVALWTNERTIHQRQLFRLSAWWFVLIFRIFTLTPIEWEGYRVTAFSMVRGSSVGWVRWGAFQTATADGGWKSVFS